MYKELGKEYPQGVQRTSFLKDNCDCVVEKGYMKAYTPEQIQAKKENLAEVSISINDIETEKKEVMKSFKEQIDPLVETRSELLKGIKEKAEFVKEECFKFVDAEERIVSFYNADGDLIESRPANHDELQGNIFRELRKTGTNN